MQTCYKCVSALGTYVTFPLTVYTTHCWRRFDAHFELKDEIPNSNCQLKFRESSIPPHGTRLVGLRKSSGGLYWKLRMTLRLRKARCHRVIIRRLSASPGVKWTEWICHYEVVIVSISTINSFRGLRFTQHLHPGTTSCPGRAYQKTLTCEHWDLCVCGMVWVLWLSIFFHLDFAQLYRRVGD